MKNKTLEDHINEMERSLNNFEMALYILTPKVCHTCKRLVIDQNDLISMYYLGECLLCDNTRGELLEYEQGSEDN